MRQIIKENNQYAIITYTGRHDNFYCLCPVTLYDIRHAERNPDGSVKIVNGFAVFSQALKDQADADDQTQNTLQANRQNLYATDQQMIRKYEDLITLLMNNGTITLAELDALNQGPAETLASSLIAERQKIRGQL